MSTHDKGQQVIDENGFRANVGIVLTNGTGKVFWAKRIGQDAWQFPQGGMGADEEPEETLYRELQEEIGLEPEDVKLLGRTKNWLRYRLPKRMVRDTQPVCIGQKQLWFLLQLVSDEQRIDLEKTGKPEFDGWSWVSYWYPLKQVVTFKRGVYRRAMKELVPLMCMDGVRKQRAKSLNFLLES